MFCTKCGAKLQENAKFCVKCGTPAKKPPVKPPVKPPIPEPEEEPKKSKKKAVIILLVIIALIAALAAGWFLVGKDWVEANILGNESSKEVGDDEDSDEEESEKGDSDKEDTEEEAVDVEKVVKKFSRYSERNYGGVTGYCLVYVDSDDVPECIAYQKGSAGDFVALLQYKDSEVDEVRSESNVASFKYVEKKSKFLFETNEPDGYVSELYALDDDEISCEKIGECAWIVAGTSGYTVDNTQATQEEYTKYIRRYEAVQRGYSTMDEALEQLRNPDESGYPDITDIIGTRRIIMAEDYVLPDSSTRYLTKADLEGLDKEQCRIARNEIYARYGRKFNDETLQAYFDAKEWYTPKMEADDFKESMLNDYEVANRDLIVEYETEKGFR